MLLCATNTYLTARASLPLWVHYGARELRRPCAWNYITLHSDLLTPRSLRQKLSASFSLSHTFSYVVLQLSGAKFRRRCGNFNPTAAGRLRIQKTCFIFLRLLVSWARETNTHGSWDYRGEAFGTLGNRVNSAAKQVAFLEFNRPWISNRSAYTIALECCCYLSF